MVGTYVAILIAASVLASALVVTRPSASRVLIHLAVGIALPTGLSIWIAASLPDEVRWRAPGLVLVVCLCLTGVAIGWPAPRRPAKAPGLEHAIAILTFVAVAIAGGLLAWTPWAGDHTPVDSAGSSTVVVKPGPSGALEKTTTTTDISMVESILTGRMQHLWVGLAILMIAFIAASLVKRSVDGDFHLKLGPLELQAVARKADRGLDAAERSIKGIDSELSVLFEYLGLPRGGTDEETGDSADGDVDSTATA